MLSYILLIIGLILLVKGAHLLVDGASSIARKLNVSDLFIGLTIVAFGTSSPELFVNIIAGINGNTEIAIGNILGSNIANVFLILGVSSIICPLVVSRGVVWKEIPFCFLSSFVLAVLANDKLIDKSGYSVLTRIDGIVFLSFFSIFIYYLLTTAKKIEKIEGMEEQTPGKQYGLLKSALIVILGLIGLIVGSKWIVDGAVHMALSLGMSQSLIGLTIVAIGTSLPELSTSVVAACKKNHEIAVGNAVGSNIFNIFFILGLSSILNELPFQMGNNIDIGMVLLSSILLFLTMFTGRKFTLDKWQGILFIVLYVSYVSFLVFQG